MAIQEWRLNNLYRVEDKAGRIVPFRLNEGQSYFYRAMWYLSIILKARQLGFSTLISIFFLDVCLFNPNTHCGIIDATIDDAKKKLGKILFAYYGLPDWIKAGCGIKSSNAFEIVFTNGSSILVGTSHRGGTLQYLHISELGKIAAKFPEKSKEIRTGALNTIQAGQFCFIESTAEGQEGDFYEFCEIAMAKARMRHKLSPMDFKFFFFPWWKAKEYVLGPEYVNLTDQHRKYFDLLSSRHGIQLTPSQKAWYVAKLATQRDEMKREYPSTPEEAFEASVEGAIFGAEMEVAERESRIGDFKAFPGVPVHMAFDIGRKDYTAIWFFQAFAGKVRCVGYYQDMLAGLPHYTEYCFGTEHAAKAHAPFVSRAPDAPIKGIFERKGWVVGDAIFPHDIQVEEWGTQRTRIEMALAAGFKAKLAVAMGLHDGINAARATIGLTEFDAEGCGTAADRSKRKGSGSNNGVSVLKAYKWKWDDVGGRWITGTESHDANSHGAHSYRYLATSWRELPAVLEPKKPVPKDLVYSTANDGSLVTNVEDIMDIVQMKLRQERLGQ
jgi:hypothetical protein